VIATAIVNSFIGIELENFIMPIIAVYKNPIDYPDKYVARIFNVDRPTVIAVIGDTLHEIRLKIPRHMIKLDRATIDDPVIVETWV